MGLKAELSITDCVSGIEKFEIWIANALIAISPFADVILFSGQTPEKLVFVAKPRKIEPTNQCVTKTLNIPLDYDEQITSVLCIPIMATKQTSLGSVDWTVLVIGLSSGYVKFYTEQSTCLLSLKFCDEPVMNLKLQTQKNNLNARSQTHFASIVDELLIVYRSCAIVCDGIGLCENLRISRDDVIKSQPSFYEPAYNAATLPSILTCQRWKFQDLCDTKVLDADLFGMRCSTRFDAMKSESINSEHIPTKSFTRTLALIGSDPFISCYREARDIVAHSYTEMLGSLLPFWSKPQPSRVIINDINLSSSLNLFDKGRLSTSIVPSPDRRLAAITDDYGRVVLMDVTNWIVVRIWKGYRNAQCGWIEVKRTTNDRNSPYASFLVIYAPKRGLLEVWSVQRGPRVAAFNVGRNCRLLYTGYKMLNMRAESLQKLRPPNLLVEQSYTTNCYLLDAKNLNVCSIEVPYTYSLYKYGDLQSRDRLLINELIGLIQREAEVSAISETLNRITLAESQERAIRKIATMLLPDRIIMLMENLISKIMKNYDNHPGESMSLDDQSIVELCKRLITMCSIFINQSNPNVDCNTTYQDFDTDIVGEFEEHPKEIDELAEHLGWTSTEILRYLSLLALAKSYRINQTQSPWPNMGEPLTWFDFIDCFDLCRQKSKSRSEPTTEKRASDRISIKLKDFRHNFLSQEKILKTALFMYNESSESFYKTVLNSSDVVVEPVETPQHVGYSYVEPSSRLVLLFQFWLSTDLCNHWKMWTFLQRHVGQISDELKVIAMAQDNDKSLIEAWKRIYHLILESDNIYAAIIATAAIRGDTLRTISDNEKREKLDKNEEEKLHQDDQENLRIPSLDWECLCVDAERMSLLIQQLEDVFLLKLLLKYSLSDGHLVESFVYRVPRISVANILRKGPTIVSELVAQWAVQANVHPKIFTEPYGLVENEADHVVMDSSTSQSRPFKFRSKTASANSTDSAKELLHHTKTSFPRSLEGNVLLLNCLWEFCNRWAKTSSATEKHQYLNKALDCLSLLDSGTIVNLKHNTAYLAYKNFFQRTFERLALLTETNSTLLSPKCLRSRETISRRELNMGEDCLDDFVQFCHNISDLMLETSQSLANSTVHDEEELKLRDQLLSLDEWWSTLSSINMLKNFPEDQTKRGSFMPAMDSISQTSGVNSSWPAIQPNSLMNAAISSSRMIDIETLIELHRLTTLLLIIFRLKLIKVYPLSLIGEKSRQILKLDLQQSPASGAAIKKRPGQVKDLRQKFARKCIVSIVEKLTNDVIVDYDGSSTDDYQDVSKKVITPSGNHEDLFIRKEHVTEEDSGKDCRVVEGWADHSTEALSDTSIENNESMVLFTQMLTLTNEWELDRDELHLELVFEMFRCNHDKLAAQISTRVIDKQTLANGLLKISSQRVLVLFGLSSQFSSELQWMQRVDKWSLFQPNVASWLKGIQEEEKKQEIGTLIFPETLKPHDHDEDQTIERTPENFDLYIEQSLGLRLYVLKALRHRTRAILETVTNYLDGQANRLAYDLLQLLDSDAFEKFLDREKGRWLRNSD